MFFRVEEVIRHDSKLIVFLDDLSIFFAGRKNRIKQKDASTLSKDNHHNNSSSSAAGGQSDISENLTSSNIQQQQPTISQICESCLRLETEVKKFKSEVSHFKQIENELKQKIESNSNAKSSLHAKQKENEELDKKLVQFLLSKCFFFLSNIFATLDCKNCCQLDKSIDKVCRIVNVE